MRDRSWSSSSRKFPSEEHCDPILSSIITSDLCCGVRSQYESWMLSTERYKRSSRFVLGGYSLSDVESDPLSLPSSLQSQDPS